MKERREDKKTFRRFSLSESPRSLLVAREWYQRYSLTRLEREGNSGTGDSTRLPLFHVALVPRLLPTFSNAARGRWWSFLVSLINEDRMGRLSRV